MSRLIGTAVSVSGASIRLTAERWKHICTKHGELRDQAAEVLACIQNPESVVVGDGGEYSAVQTCSDAKWLIVVYREAEGDGFVITAFTTRRARYYLEREQIWPLLK